MSPESFISQCQAATTGTSQARELRAAEREYRGLVERMRAALGAADDALRVVHDLMCHEWNTRQFIGGDARAVATARTRKTGGGMKGVEGYPSRCQSAVPESRRQPSRIRRSPGACYYQWPQVITLACG